MLTAALRPSRLRRHTAPTLSEKPQKSYSDCYAFNHIYIICDLPTFVNRFFKEFQSILTLVAATAAAYVINAVKTGVNPK